VTVDAAFTTDLAAVRAALSHKIPDGNLVAVLHECLRVTLAATTKRRRNAGRARPAPATGAAGRYIPAAIRDAVWRRDDGRCAFVSADGRRCDSTHQLELHHLVPFARGGAATVDGLALRCKAHNLHEARRDFGDEHIEHATARARRARSPRLDLLPFPNQGPPQVRDPH
jgi:5-methylcytosine-specific restriction endonuclease McrA